MQQYHIFTKTWVLANSAGNDTVNIIHDRLKKVLPAEDHRSFEISENDTHQTMNTGIANKDHLQSNISDSEVDANHNDANEVFEQCDDGEDQFLLQVVRQGKARGKLDEKLVIPTRSATQHLLSKHETIEAPARTNSEPVTPILRNSPKDLATLYTVLCMLQEISAEVVGPNRRVIITLDMDLYKSSLQIQKSVKNKKLVTST